MSKYIAKYEAIIDLHERGYWEDFQLVGNDLLWSQGKEMIRAGDFSITEYHLFFDSKQVKTSLIIFGVIALHHNIKGILIHHYKNYPFRMTSVIRKKLNDISVYAQDEKFNSDFAAQLLGGREKMAWMIRAYLNPKISK